MSEEKLIQEMSNDPVQDDTVTFHMHKGQYYRVIYMSGAIGGLTPELNVQMTIYNERLPLPRVVVNQVKEDGTLGDEISELREGKKGVVREMEGTLVMSLETATRVHAWLGKQIAAGNKEIDAKVDAIRTRKTADAENEG